jgi:hypothetical protein
VSADRRPSGKLENLMADFLNEKQREITARLNELRPLVDE